MDTIVFTFFVFRRNVLDLSVVRDNKTKLLVLTYLLLFVVLCGACNTEIYHSGLMPFGVGIVFALLFVKFNGYLLGLVYLLSYSLAGLSLNAVLIAGNVAIVLVVLEYLIKKKKMTLKKWHIFVASIVAQILYVALNLGDINDNLALFVSVLLGVMFLYSNLSFFNATINRGMMTRLNMDEKICGSVFLIIFMTGMSCVNISVVNLGLIFATLIILVCTYLCPSGLAIIVSSLIGISFSITSSNAIFVSMFVIIAICSIAFRCNFKYFSIVSVIVGYVIFNLFFGVGISYGEIISVVIGGIIFAFVPMKMISAVGEVFGIKSQVLIKNIINKSKQQIVNRVKDLSVVFSEMDQVYRKMIKGQLSDEKAIEMLKGELVSSLCKDCPNYDKCYRTESNFLDNSIDTIISIAYEKGKILLIDIPSYLTTNCVRLNQLVNNLNTMIASYKEYTNVITNLDMSRALIADQLSGVSQVLTSLGREVDTNISFEHGFENRIIEELSYKNIICIECVIYEKDISEKIIHLIVKNDTIDDNMIIKIVSKVLNNKLIIQSIEPAEIIGASIVTIASAPNYDIAFGSSSVNKTGMVVSGDSQSLIKLDNDKYMVSICDGMGSGAKAHSISRLTISLIENFYRAGFENEVILNSVNKLLSLTEEENFSTIDLCIIDCKKNIYDFIKLGATNGYLKRHRGECEEIQSSGLPIGVLEEIRPHITKRLISPYDMLVFVSDGVSDSFENKCDLRLYVSTLDIINPQTLSQNILDKALSLNGGIARDDMTVICVRVFNCD